MLYPYPREQIFVGIQRFFNSLYSDMKICFLGKAITMPAAIILDTLICSSQSTTISRTLLYHG